MSSKIVKSKKEEPMEEEIWGDDEEVWNEEEEEMKKRPIRIQPNQNYNIVNVEVKRISGYDKYIMEDKSGFYYVATFNLIPWLKKNPDKKAFNLITEEEKEYHLPQMSEKPYYAPKFKIYPPKKE